MAVQSLHIVRRKCQYLIPHQILNFYPWTRKLNIHFTLLPCYYFTFCINVVFTNFNIWCLSQNNFQFVGPSTQLLTSVILLRWYYGPIKYEDGATVHSFTAILSDKILLCHGPFLFWNSKVDQKIKYPSFVNLSCL
jgi:hypothetical protein